MAVLTALHLSKAYGDTQVLNSVSFVINEGEKVGLVGANGVGKSTVLKIIMGKVEPDAGSVLIQPDAILGYLPQALDNLEGSTVEQVIDAARGNLARVEQRLRAVEIELSRPGVQAPLLAEYAQLSDEFERRGGYSVFEVDQIMDGLGLSQLERTRTVDTLSGGEKSRLGLATLLLRSPDLLLLDEPTNHLDAIALGWLETYLAKWRGAMFVVSHDREFLDNTVNEIVEIDESSRESRIYAGNYTEYAAERVRERARQLADFEAQQEEIRELRRIVRTRGRQVAHNRPPKDSDGFYYAFKSGRVDATVARNVHAAEEKLRRIEEDPIARPPLPLAINPAFDPLVFGSRTPLTIEGVAKSWDGRPLFDEISATIGARARIVITGPNGSGKSTLLKIMAGTLAADAGRVRRAPGVVVGYLDQEEQVAAAAVTVYEAWAEGQVGDFETLKTELLSYGLFTWPELTRPVDVLSLGQKRKLQIARLLSQRANVLLLDEPTNHVSLDVLEQFERALLDFPGPVVAVSHDRRFIDRFAEELWLLEAGTLRRTYSILDPE